MNKADTTILGVPDFARGVILNPKYTIDKSICLLMKRIGRPFPSLILSKDDYSFLEQNYNNEKGVRYLAQKIFRHVKYTVFQYKVSVIHSVGLFHDKTDFFVDSSGMIHNNAEEINKAGKYYCSSSGIPCIQVNIRPYYKVDTVVAIMCHECMHHFLQSMSIAFPLINDNEILTDVAAAYMGLGTYMVNGYEPIEYREFDKTITHFIGYVKADDFRHINYKLNVIKDNYDRYDTEVRMLKHYKEAAEKQLKVFHDVFEMYQSCLDILLSKKSAALSIADTATLQQYIINRDNDAYKEKQLSLKVQEIKSERDYVEADYLINAACTDYSQRTTMIGKYL